MKRLNRRALINPMLLLLLGFRISSDHYPALNTSSNIMAYKTFMSSRPAGGLPFPFSALNYPEDYKTSLSSRLAGGGKSAHMDVLVKRYIDQIYNLEIDNCLTTSDSIIYLFPRHPLGYMFKSVAYWQWLFLYKNKNRELLNKFYIWNKKTIKISKEYQKLDKVQGMFFLGGAYGYRGRAKISEGKNLSAFFDARRGKNLLLKVKKLDPTLYDVDYGLGIYDYYLDEIPAFIKLFTYLIIGEGNKERGYRELQNAMRNGYLTRIEAKLALAKMYSLETEKKYEEAVKLLLELIDQYPKYFEFKYHLMLVYQKLEQWELSISLNRELITQIETQYVLNNEIWIPDLKYKLGESLLFSQRYIEAKEIFEELIKLQLSPELKPWVILRMGNIADVEGKREKALGLYRISKDFKGELTPYRASNEYRKKPFQKLKKIILKPERLVI
jgi:tetratricopeptide (TPR) repeat protein